MQSRFSVPLVREKINMISNEQAAFLALGSCEEDCLVITIRNPEIIRRRYGLKCQFLWITYYGRIEDSMVPDRLEFEILDSVRDFTRRGGKCILIHGLEYLSLVLSKDDVFRFVRDVKSMAEDLTIILAVNGNLDEWSPLADAVYVSRLKIKDPLFLIRDPPPGARVFRISKNPDEADIKVSNSEEAERLLFSGMDLLKDVREDVHIDCVDYLITAVDERKTVLFLKDLMDILSLSGGKVYVSPSPGVLTSPVAFIAEYTGTEVEEGIFVGREREISILRKMMDEVLAGHGRTVFVSGEAGIGKTTLVSQVIAHAISRGFTVMKGKSYYSTTEPYLPIKEALGNYAEDLLAAERGHRLENERVLEARRTSIFYELTRRIRDLAERTPVLLFFDDIHWMDSSSLRLLHYMAENLKNSRVLIITTYRPEDAEDELLSVMRRMSREGIMQEIVLEPLSLEETKMMARAITSGELSEDVIEEIHMMTSGNPLFTREVVLQLSEKGMTPKEYLSRGFSPPRIISDLVGERMSKLDESTRKMMEIASLLGDVIDVKALEELTGLDEMEIVEGVEMAARYGLLRESDEGFVFAHSIIREVIASGLSSLKARVLHRKIAGVLEKLYDGDRELDIARHYVLAGEREKAFEHYIRAGERAMNAYAYESAIRIFREALDIREDVSVLEMLGNAYVIIGEYDEARKVMWRALKIARDNEKIKRLYRIIAKTFESQGDFKKAIKYLKAGLEVDDEETSETSKLVGMMGWVLTREGKYREAKELLEREMEIARKNNDLEGVANAHDHLGILHYRMGNYDLAIEHLEKSLALAKEINDEILISATLNNIGIVYEEIGEIDLAVKYYEESVKMAEKIGDKYTMGAILNNIGVAYIDMGEYEKAIEYLERAREIEEAIGDKYGIALVLDNLGNIHRERGEIEEAIKYHLNAIQLGRDIESEGIEVECMVSLAEDYLAMGDLEEARRIALEALQMAEKVNSKPFVRAAHRIIGKICREEGKLDEAMNYFILAMPPREENSAELAITEYEMAILLHRMGKRGEAYRYLKDALELFAKMGFRKWMHTVEEKMREFGFLNERSER